VTWNEVMNKTILYLVFMIKIKSIYKIYVVKVLSFTYTYYSCWILFVMTSSVCLQCDTSKSECWSHTALHGLKLISLDMEFITIRLLSPVFCSVDYNNEISRFGELH